MTNWLNTYRRYACDIHRINQEVKAHPQELILTVEHIFHSDIRQIVDRILEIPVKRHIIYLSGPSSSGKTTTAMKLSEAFEAKGCHVILISMDDFYLGKDYVRKLPNGKYDFESIEALDISLMRQCAKQAMQSGECDIPVYDFPNSRRSGVTRHIQLEKDSVVIVEGIHALNPIFSDPLISEYVSKLYIGVKQGVKDNEDYVLSNRDIRLLRRIVRDDQFRGTAPDIVMERWEDVIEGEQKNIRPYRYTSDFTLNTIHIYEPCLIKDRAIRLLSQIDASSPVAETAQRLSLALSCFESVEESLVPDNSLMREFIGGSRYEY